MNYLSNHVHEHEITETPLDEARPEPIVIASECDHCDTAISITLECWKLQELSEDFWVRDTRETISLNDRLCDPCLDRKIDGLERAREYTSDVPASWFDPTYAGERW